MVSLFASHCSNDRLLVYSQRRIRSSGTQTLPHLLTCTSSPMSCCVPVVRSQSQSRSLIPFYLVTTFCHTTSCSNTTTVTIIITTGHNNRITMRSDRIPVPRSASQ